ncbi:amidase [Bailinhaonella thermotolerans]|nr:amidase family protein [Bailinhaonella thermotolerans]
MDDAIALADLVRTGQATPRELVEAAIGRIEALDGGINAVVHRRFERALDEADALPDDPAMPFRGVPILLKDLGWNSEGDPCASGTRVLAKYRAQGDDHGVRRLRRAGFVVLGRTNTPELGTTITTEPVSTGPTRHPRDPAYSAGGSSGGSAAAVAAGMVPLATASDGGGSIRIPASVCGLVGLKPSRGRVSPGPRVSEGWGGFSVPGVLTRSVRDTAALLELLSGREPGDPYDAPPLRPVPPEPGVLRVGYLARDPRDGVPGDPDCAAAVENAARLLAGLGHEVAPGYPYQLGDHGFAGHYGVIVSSHVAAEVEHMGRMRGRPVEPGELEPRNQIMAAAGKKSGATRYIASLQWLNDFRVYLAEWWKRHDLLLTPAMGVAPFPLGWIPADDFTTAMDRTGRAIAFTSPFNATGQPAISLPLHRTAAGLPVGVQLVAAYGREDLLLSVAAQLEPHFTPLPEPGTPPGRSR